MSGTDFKNKKLIAEGPVIILCEPQLGQNIGMVARAMANFGLWELRLVAPRDGWPNEQAIKAASGADHVIEAVTVYENLAQAIGDLSFVMATTARPRDLIKPVREAEQAAADLRHRFNKGEKTGLLFGRERWGLNNDEIVLADEIVTFPVNPAFASLNIAQAVLLICYEWMKSANINPVDEVFKPDEVPVADKKHLVGLMDHLEASLDEAGYFFPPARRETMAQTVRNIFTHMKLKEKEIQTLRGVIAAIERRWQRRSEK